MKKVWVLEKYQTKEDMNKTFEQFREMYESLKEDGTEEQIETAKKLVEKQRDTMKNNPNGYWYGIEGKSIYRQFCEVAKDAIRRADKGTQFRVVEGEITDDAKYWTGYKFVRENEGVLKYLMVRVKEY